MPVAGCTIEGRCEVESSAQVGKSPYTADLLQLERCAPVVAQPVCPQLAVIRTQLKVKACDQALVQHSDQEFVGYILRGISGGFRIGFNYQRCSCRPARSNMKSATENAGVVKGYLLTELTAGRVVGPFCSGKHTGHSD